MAKDRLLELQNMASKHNQQKNKVSNASSLCFLKTDAKK